MHVIGGHINVAEAEESLWGGWGYKYTGYSHGEHVLGRAGGMLPNKNFANYVL